MGDAAVQDLRLGRAKGRDMSRYERSFDLTLGCSLLYIGEPSFNGAPMTFGETLVHATISSDSTRRVRIHNAHRGGMGAGVVFASQQESISCPV